MTSRVQRLAEAPCHAKTADNPYHDEACCFCHGTGALVPGLRWECPAKEVHIASGEKHHPSDCWNCQGRGWVLIKEVEHTAILLTYLHNLQGSYVLISRVSKTFLVSTTYQGRILKGKGASLNEALAHTIYLAKST